MTVDYYSTSVAEPYKFNLSLVCDGVEDEITSIDLKLKGVAMVDRSKAEPAKPATKPNEAKVLKLLDGKSEGLLVAEIAKAVDMDQSNCGRLLRAMAKRELVVGEGKPKRYRKP